MDKFSGTPGPWVADKTSRSVGPISRDDDQSYGMVIPVAWIEFDPEIEIQAANQNIIAAAPELLEALKDVLHAYDKHGEHSEWDFARSAIAKALGK